MKNGKKGPGYNIGYMLGQILVSSIVIVLIIAVIAVGVRLISAILGI